MKDLLTSVVIPVSRDSEFLGQCLDRVTRQDFDKKEIILVCDPRAADLPSLPQGSEDLRVIKQKEPCTLAHLINRGMRAARGHVKILLMPHCVPVGDGWMRNMVQPLQDDAVGVVVSQCFMLDRKPGLPARLLDSVDPQQRRNSKGEPRPQQVVSHQCDAYRASLLADIGYFEDDRLATPGEAVDVSIKIADAGYSIVLSDAAVAAYNVPKSNRRVWGVLMKALDYGYSDAVLDRLYDLRWLNSAVFAAAFFSLFLLPLATASVPIAVICSTALFVWGWFLGVRLPVLGWECPMAALNLGVYVLIILLIRHDWWPQVLGREAHPAIIRQWCWVGAVVGTYLLLLLKAGLQGALRTCRTPRGVLYAVPVLFLGMVWWLLAGIGYLRGRIVGPPAKE